VRVRVRVLVSARFFVELIVLQAVLM
jgi:hypothetical protein